MSGNGSQWTVRDALDIATEGTAIVRIQSGAQVESLDTYLGLDATGQGAVTVEGAGSQWRNLGGLWIGSFGQGNLQVQAGASVESVDAYIGDFYGAQGVATVSGVGAQWHTDRLIVGNGGKASLAIGSQGAVSVVRPVVLAQYTGAVGDLYIGAMSSNPLSAVAAGHLIAPLQFGEGSATLHFNHTNTSYDFDSVLSSVGNGVHRIQHYAGETRLSADSPDFQGHTLVQGGSLEIAQQLGGDAEVTGGQLTVNGVLRGAAAISGAGALAGSGEVQGTVTFTNGGRLLGTQAQALDVGGNLRLDSSGQVRVALGAASSQALFRVSGDLLLDGGLQVSDLGGFGVGVYRLFDYGGRLEDRGISIDATPAGVALDQLRVQTSVVGQINLTSAVGSTLYFWDGGDATRYSNARVDGGTGRWHANGQGWTEVDGVLNGPFQPNPGFAVFQGEAGVVTVDRSAGALAVTGMQFASSGYRLEGDVLDVVGLAGETRIRVGDGSSAGAAMWATIAAPLSGLGTLVKTDRGWLVLAGSNRFTGGVRVEEGWLSISRDDNLGSSAGGLQLQGGNLFTTASFDTARTLTLGSQTSAVLVADHTELGWMGEIQGSGNLIKQGEGTLRLGYSGNQYTGRTEIVQGRLLAAAPQVLSPQSSYVVAAGAHLDLAGHAQTLSALRNAGRVTIGVAEAGHPGTTLTLTGPYVGESGILELTAVLQGAGSPSDVLLLHGPNAVASGKTFLKVLNVGGMGQATGLAGIPVVKTENGAVLPSGVFELSQGHVDAGAYEYRLRSDAQGASLYALGDGGAQTSYRAEASLLMALPAQLRQADLAMLGTLYQRVGEYTGVGNEGLGASKVWGRWLHSEPRIRQQGVLGTQSRADLSGFQLGLDLWRQGSWSAGAYIGQLQGDMHVRGFSGGLQGVDVGRNSLRSRYLGGYATYQSDRGWYMDAVLQVADYRSDLRTQRDARAVTKGHGWLASVELGKNWSLPAGWALEPQVQLVHRHAHMKGTALAATQVGIEAADDWMLRLGARIHGRLATPWGVVQPSIRANIYRAGRTTDVLQFVTSHATTQLQGYGGHTSSEVLVGGSWRLTPLTGMQVEVGKMWAHGGDTRIHHGMRWNIGLTWRW